MMVKKPLPVIHIKNLKLHSVMKVTFPPPLKKIQIIPKKKIIPHKGDTECLGVCGYNFKYF